MFNRETNMQIGFFGLLLLILLLDLGLTSWAYSTALDPFCNEKAFEPNMALGWAYMIDTCLGVGTGFASLDMSIDYNPWIFMDMFQTVFLGTFLLGCNLSYKAFFLQSKRFHREHIRNFQSKSIEQREFQT